MTSRVRNGFLIRYVTFDPPKAPSSVMSYKGQQIGWVKLLEGRWSYGFMFAADMGTAVSRHNATEALLEAWLDTQDAVQ